MGFLSLFFVISGRNALSLIELQSHEVIKVSDGGSFAFPLGWTGKEFLCFGSPTALFASQHNLFRTM